MKVFERIGLREKFVAIAGFCMVLILFDAYRRGQPVFELSDRGVLYGLAVAVPLLFLYEGLRTLFDRGLPDLGLRVEIYISVALFAAVVTFLIFGFGVGAVGDRTPSPTDNQYLTVGESELDADEVEELVHQEVNEVREEYGLSGLGYDEELAEIARGHSRDMAEHEYVGHVDSEGRDQTDRAREEGYSCSKETHTGVGENAHAAPFRERILWHGYISSEEELAELIVEGWVESEGHYRNLVEENYSRHGIGVVEGEKLVYVTQKLC